MQFEGCATEPPTTIHQGHFSELFAFAFLCCRMRCGFLKSELSQSNKEEGVNLLGCLETLGVELRTRVKNLGAKEKARKKRAR